MPVKLPAPLGSGATGDEFNPCSLVLLPTDKIKAQCLLAGMGTKGDIIIGETWRTHISEGGYASCAV